MHLNVIQQLKHTVKIYSSLSGLLFGIVVVFWGIDLIMKDFKTMNGGDGDEQP